jgi:nitrogen fixation protein FixH
MYLKSRTSLSVLMVAFTLVLGCGDSNPGGQQPTGETKLTLEVTVSPDPPTVGQNTMTITVTDQDGKAVTGATITVDPQMPMHGHGSSEAAVVEDQGAGTYRAHPVTFQMPGSWEVTVKATSGEVTSSKVLTYDVK